MPRLQPPQRALRVLTQSSRQPYICTACRIRQFHSSTPFSAEQPLLTRVRDSLFGDKRSREAEKLRDEKSRQAAEQESHHGQPRTRQGRKGGEYSVAPRVDPTVNTEYVMANTWDGLDRVGSEEWVKARLDQGEVYEGFAPSRRVRLNTMRWIALLRYVTVEVLLLRDAGRDVHQVCYPRGDRYEQTLDELDAFTIQVNDGGNASLHSKAEDAVKETILRTIPETRDAGMEPDKLVDVLSAVTQVEDSHVSGDSTPLWLRMRLSDPNIKLAITKRMMQLTGIRLPDPTISTSATLFDLFTAYETKPEPKKVAHTPEFREMKNNNKGSNVRVYALPRTFMEKEKEIGRWKMIEDELRARDLPVLEMGEKGKWDSSSKARIDN